MEDCPSAHRRNSQISWVSAVLAVPVKILSSLLIIHWGGRIRTFEYRFQRPVPYHLATPQALNRCQAGALLASLPCPSISKIFPRYSARVSGSVTTTAPPPCNEEAAFTA